MGIASTVSPMYIAEVSPEKIRGRLVAIQQLNIVIGILLAQLINYLILQSHPIAEGVSGIALLDTWNGQSGWRYMFAAEGIWAFLFFVCLFAVPNSPRWLCRVEKDVQASPAIFFVLNEFLRREQSRFLTDQMFFLVFCPFFSNFTEFPPIFRYTFGCTLLFVFLWQFRVNLNLAEGL